MEKLKEPGVLYHGRNPVMVPKPSLRTCGQHTHLVLLGLGELVGGGRALQGLVQLLASAVGDRQGGRRGGQRRLGGPSQQRLPSSLPPSTDLGDVGALASQRLLVQPQLLQQPFPVTQRRLPPHGRSRIHTTEVSRRAAILLPSFASMVSRGM